MATKGTISNKTKLDLLMQILGKVRSTLDLDEILNLLLDSLQPVIAHDAAGIFILKNETMYRHERRSQTLIDGIARRGFDPAPEEDDRMLMFGEGIVGDVIRTGEAVLVPDVSRDDRYIIGRKRTRSEIAVPILLEGRTIGALNLESDRLNAFGENDLEVLRFFANAISISIETAILHLNLLEKQHIDQQLETAREIQEGLLPAHAPEIKGYDIGGLCVPTSAIGGDYYDFFRLDNERLGVALADVCGHGVPAALVTSALRALLRTHARNLVEPGMICEKLNAVLPEFSGRDDFVTGVYGILDSRTGTFTYANCGHPPILCVRTNGTIEAHRKGGPALGVLEQVRYETGLISLGKGDMLLLYSDGIVEMENEEGVDFGGRRLRDALLNTEARSAAEVIERITRAAIDFCRTDRFEDDLTLVVIRCNRRTAA